MGWHNGTDGDCSCCPPSFPCLHTDDCLGITDVTDLDILANLGTNWEDIQTGSTCNCDALDDAEFALTWDGGVSTSWTYTEENWCADMSNDACTAFPLGYDVPVDLELHSLFVCSPDHTTCHCAFYVRFSGTYEPFGVPTPFEEEWVWTETATEAQSTWANLVFDKRWQPNVPYMADQCFPCTRSATLVVPTLSVIVP